MSEPLMPRIGVASIVVRDGQVLLGLRRSNSHGDRTWQFPGGHLDAFESVEACAIRETREETGLDVVFAERGPFTNDLYPTLQRHYVTLFVVTHAPHGEPRRCEPDKCEEWRWFAWDRLPAPLFTPIVNLLQLGYRPTGV